MSLKILLFHCANDNLCSNLSRVDITSLPHQTLMELLIQDIEQEHNYAFQDEHGAFYDICEWEGVECDCEGNVTEIQWSEIQSETTIELKWLPQTTQSFELIECMLCGTLNCASLPSQMHRLTIFIGAFEGSVSLPDLPDGMQHLELHCDCFFGSLDFVGLPKNLQYIGVSLNDFEGTVNFTSLPESLRKMFLDSNKFHGSVDLHSLPQSMEHIDISDNAFAGSVDLSAVPHTLCTIDFRENQFSGKAIVTLTEDRNVNLTENCIEMIVDVDGKEIIDPRAIF